METSTCTTPGEFESFHSDSSDSSESSEMDSEGQFGFDTSKCIVCFEKLSDKRKGPFTKKPSRRGLETIFECAKLKNDAIYHVFWAFKDDILSKKIKVMYHNNCRATYTSPQHVARSKCEKGMVKYSPIPSTSSNHPSTRMSGTSDSPSANKFNVRTHCFICEQKGKKGGCYPTKICTGKGQKTQKCVKTAAEQRLDDKMVGRMYEDLFAYDARYHRSCMSQYLSPRNIQAEVNRKIKAQSTIIESPYEKAFTELIPYIEHEIIAEKNVIQSTDLLQKYIALLELSHIENATNYRFTNLKERLTGHFGGQISFIPREGKTTVVCSTVLTVGEAFEKINAMESTLDHIEEQEDFSMEVEEQPSQILHQAASILRSAIGSIDMNMCNDSYIPSSHISKDECIKFVPPELYDFISLCTNSSKFKDGLSASTMVDGHDMRVVSTCHNIISMNRNKWTPLTLGLGILLHHDFGSKNIVQLMHALGYSISYNEVRRFETSAAIKELEDEDDDGYIPSGIEKPTDDGNIGLVDSAIDNFDQNEDTIDGKGSTHAMAMVLYQRSENKNDNKEPIKRTNKTSLEDTDIRNYENQRLLNYKKPKVTPTPNPISSKDDIEMMTKSSSYHRANKSDLMWRLVRYMRQSEGQKQNVPAWGGFNSLIYSATVNKAIVRYLPFINASPSDHSTIYTALIILAKIAKKLDQEHMLVTADLAIYSKAQQILFNHLVPIRKNITMRIGNMHLTATLIASIGKLYSEGGLIMMLTESDVYAAASAKQMLQGKHFDRGIRSIKMASEACFRLMFESAEDYWLSCKKTSLIGEVAKSKLNDLQEAIGADNQTQTNTLCLELQTIVGEIEEKLKEFRNYGRGQSKTFTYWDNFIEASDVLLRLVRADRCGDFQLHLESVSDAIPWFIAAGRTNYARYTPVYLSEMKSLEVKNPAAYKHMMDGGFVIRRTENNSFNAVPTDQGLEQTINKECKSAGGVVGFTRRKGALVRWLVTRHITSEYSESVNNLRTSNTTKKPHEECQPKRIEKDEDDVRKICSLVGPELFQNPFDLDSVPSNLINIATGQIATKPIENDLTGMVEQSKKHLEKFLDNKLDKSTIDNFWKPEPRMKIKTFADLQKSQVEVNGKKIHIESEVLFRRLCVASKERNIDLADVLKYELCSIPPSLFNDDGTMRKTAKSELAKKIEANADSYEVPPLVTDTSAYIVDGMALLQTMNESLFNTYDDLADIFLVRILNLMRSENNNVKNVTVAFDRYDNETSIKSAERQRRGEDLSASHKIASGRTVPNYRRFLKNSKNKANLANFISNKMCEIATKKLKNDESIILAGGFEKKEKASTITSTGSYNAEDMEACHDEADTLMIYHAVLRSSTAKRVIVRCSDTDVLVMLLYYYHTECFTTSHEIFMHSGQGSKQRFIPIHIIGEKLGEKFCKSLPAAHALTGCDTTCSFAKIGKNSAYTKLIKNIDHLSNLSKLGSDPNCIDSFNAARLYTVILYNVKGRVADKTTMTLDDLRFVLASTTDKPASALPPTEDAFKQHLLRAHLQCQIWTNAHVAKPELWNPEDNGWYLIDGSLVPKMILSASAPIELRDVTHIYCKDEFCTNQTCKCLLAGLLCMSICSCEPDDCQNTMMVEEKPCPDV